MEKSIIVFWCLMFLLTLGAGLGCLVEKMWKDSVLFLTISAIIGCGLYSQNLDIVAYIAK